MNHLLALLFLLASTIQSCHSQDTSKKVSAARSDISKERIDSLALHVPEPRGFINDFGQLFSNDQIRVLDSLVTTFEKATTVEIGVATVDSMMVNNKDFEDYTLVMMRKWGVGKKEKNNGVLIVISRDLKRIRIQNGYGIENYLSDADTKYIIENSFVPKFKEGKYFEGTRNGIIALIARLKQSGL